MSSTANEDVRERFYRQLLDPRLLSRFFDSSDFVPPFELLQSTDVVVIDDYLQLRRQQNAHFAEIQLKDGTLALQRGDHRMAQQHFQQGLNMIPTHEALKQAMQQMHTKAKPAMASKSERNLRNAALENSFLSQIPTAVTSNDPKYPILNEPGGVHSDSSSFSSSRRHRKRSKKKKEKHKKKEKKKKKKKRRKRHRPDSSSSMSSVTDAHNSADDRSLSSRERNSIIETRTKVDSNTHVEAINRARFALDNEIHLREENKRKHEENDSPGSLGTVDSMIITRKKQRSR